MKNAILISCLVFFFTACNRKTICNDKDCSAASGSTNSSTELKCKLTSSQMQERKATVLTSLRNKVIETKELENGYSFKFKGDDKTIDELTGFIKSERACCDFFAFDLAVTGDTTAVWFSLTGPGEAKKFIKTEMEL